MLGLAKLVIYNVIFKFGAAGSHGGEQARRFEDKHLYTTRANVSNLWIAIGN